MASLAIAVRDAIRAARTAPPGFCLIAAAAVTATLKLHGIPALFQAGSASWPRVTPAQDDGVCSTHYSYVWTPPAPGYCYPIHGLPEIHCWTVIPVNGTYQLIDATTGDQMARCKQLTGMDWPGIPLPDCWAGPFDAVPDGWLYEADAQAIRLALDILSYEASNF